MLESPRPLLAPLIFMLFENVQKGEIKSYALREQIREKLNRHFDEDV